MGMSQELVSKSRKTLIIDAMSNLFPEKEQFAGGDHSVTPDKSHSSVQSKSPRQTSQISSILQLIEMHINKRGKSE